MRVNGVNDGTRSFTCDSIVTFVNPCAATDLGITFDIENDIFEVTSYMIGDAELDIGTFEITNTYDDGNSGLIPDFNGNCGSMQIEAFYADDFNNPLTSSTSPLRIDNVNAPAGGL